LLFIFLAGFGGYSLANSSFFDLKEMTVEGNAVLSREEVIQLSGLRIGANLLKVSRQQAEAGILAQPYVKEAKISRSLPDKVNIRIVERSPMALISGVGRYLVLDEEGYCLLEVGLAAAESWTLPSIRCTAEAMLLEPGDKSEDEGVLAALALIRELDPFFLENILEFDAPSAEKLAVINIDGLPVYFGPPDNLERKLQFYEELLIKNKEQCNVHTLNYVDLRYDTQPILSRK
jgi:cell division protein FtsQ